MLRDGIERRYGIETKKVVTFVTTFLCPAQKQKLTRTSVVSTQTRSTTPYFCLNSNTIRIRMAKSKSRSKVSVVTMARLLIITEDRAHRIISLVERKSRDRRQKEGEIGKILSKCTENAAKNPLEFVMAQIYNTITKKEKERVFMVRPQYSNALAVTYNPELKEVVINFAHDYPVLAAPVQEGQEKPAGLQTATAKEDVCGVVLSEDIAGELRDILTRALPSK